MDLGLAGKVAWVLGASSGLGRASAEALASEGARVALSARGTDALEDAAAEIHRASGSDTTAVPLDVTDAAGIAAAHASIVAELGVVDILVANAGGPPPGTFDEIDESRLHHAFTLTTESAWRLVRAVLPDMRRQGRGCILFITSSSTKEIIPTLALSNMMRAAVVGMAKTLSKEVGAEGIRVCCVAPGRIDTPRVQALDRRAAESSSRSEEEIRSASQRNIAMRRYGTPREFGDVVAFLASDRASYVTGTTVVVDGGLLNGVLS
ncbi:MAG: SDR family oxidoreductase [Actinomycetota bacterium]|nr:SDR family oxidoreductase [Actinomycetota bacterium]